MNWKEKARNYATGAVIGASALAGLSEARANPIEVSTQLPQSYLIADGTTQYQMNVQVDLTPNPTLELSATNWKVFIPGYFTLNPPVAQLPAVNDIFEGYTMFDNIIDDTPTSSSGGYILDFNGRSTWGAVGPSNRVGDLENIFFTVNTDAPIGYVARVGVHPASGPNFVLFGVNFSDTTGALYTISNGNLTLYSSPFTIIPSVLGDADLDGDVDAFDFGTWQANFPAATDPSADAWSAWGRGDFDLDGDVDAFDFGAWQANFPSSPGTAPSGVPEPATVTLLLGLAASVAPRRRG